MRKTKIICTLGPSTDDDDILRRLMIEGMNVARFNFSHGDHAQHKRNMERIMKFRTELNLPVATLLDTKGPEIRVKDFKNGKIELKPGQTFTLTTDEVEGDEKMVSITYKNLVNDVKPGNTILIDDGLIEMTVEQVSDSLSCGKWRTGIKSQRGKRTTRKSVYAIYQRPGSLGHYIRYRK